jgi:hypothetical protein
MAHLSENVKPLELKIIKINDIRNIGVVGYDNPAVYLFRLPFRRTSNDAQKSRRHFIAIEQLCSRLHCASTVCVLTTPADAAALVAALDKVLNLRHWVVIKTTADAYQQVEGQIPMRHAALLLFNKDDKGIRHTTTRIRYTYCPTCGKTTKDYGGKKHMYHEVGTLISDVWRDIEWDPQKGIEVISTRLRDLLGVEPYSELTVCDLSECPDLMPANEPVNRQPTPDVHPRRLRSRLIHGNCLEALRSIPDNSIDFCFADLPYNLRKKYYKSKDDREIVEYFAWCDEWLRELYRVLKPGHTLAVLNVPIWSARHYQFLSSIMEFQAWITWDALGFPVRKIMPAHYSLLCFSKGEARWLPGLVADDNDEDEATYLLPQGDSFCIRPSCVTKRVRLGINDRAPLCDIWHDIHRLKHNSRRVNHPCQLPPLLMRRLFALFTERGEIILDSFDGAGTSTLVAHQMGRRYIGIEISKRYHNLALKRHQEIIDGIDPFEGGKEVPNAKNSHVQRLPKQKYPVSKKILQLEVKRIAEELGRIPTREDVKLYSQHPIQYYKDYFINWGEVCAAARTTGMSERPSV